MPSLIHDLHDLLASWKAEAQTFDACDMPASALAFRECHRRLREPLNNAPQISDTTPMLRSDPCN
ncbi:hypothetical protein [Xanthomonas hortorum]|uniref:hypothetical protein n=1 Tax=Xanthomonas hortorum TaxID=56454 RepID=UPI001F183AB2|nr:hypothetical protein [Xanthomonas hortorum]MCE4530390.1 hypothetical protein [Xanthomonas hortorum pv. vitians]